jgi:enamine deaminase RidA (YjgF/YER057c/UK114 family)
MSSARLYPGNVQGVARPATYSPWDCVSCRAAFSLPARDEAGSLPGADREWSFLEGLVISEDRAMKRLNGGLLLAVLVVVAAGFVAVCWPGPVHPSVRQNKKEQTREVQRLDPTGLQKSPNYTHVITVRGGKTVFIAGQVAYDGTRGATRLEDAVVGKGDLRAQARQVCKNLKTALAAVGATPADVVKINVYIKNYNPDKDLAVIQQVVTPFFPKDKLPTSTVVGVQSLALKVFLIEIEAVAVLE